MRPSSIAYHKCSNFPGRDVQGKVLQDSNSWSRRVFKADTFYVNNSFCLIGPFTAFVERIYLRCSVDKSEELCGGGPSSLKGNRVGRNYCDVKSRNDDREEDPGIVRQLSEFRILLSFFRVIADSRKHGP